MCKLVLNETLLVFQSENIFEFEPFVDDFVCRTKVRTVCALFKDDHNGLDMGSVVITSVVEVVRIFSATKISPILFQIEVRSVRRKECCICIFIAFPTEITLLARARFNFLKLDYASCFFGN